MRACWAVVIASSSAVLASCSLVTTWDGLTSGEGSGAGGAARDGGADATAPDGDAGACTPTGHYCGGDEVGGVANTLYTCNGGAPPSVLEVCAYGCIVRPAGEDDTCRCQPGGAYCGGDKVEGNVDTLYHCNQDGSGTVIEHCAKGCKVIAGQDDACG